MVSPLVPGAKLAMARGLQKVSHGGSGGCQLVCQLVYQSKKTTAEGRQQIVHVGLPSTVLILLCNLFTALDNDTSCRASESLGDRLHQKLT
ncbi:hypothetical protein WJX82_007999 [Trebouxia sp. C0006]